MLIYHENNTITFSLFSAFPDLVCALSTRKIGSLIVHKQLVENALPLTAQIPVALNELVVMEQTHGNLVVTVDEDYAGKFVSGADGLITGQKDLFLTVNTADCVPLFFFDPIKKLVATAHAGWRGTLGRIATEIIAHMLLLDSDPQDILVVIGPHIGTCCYSVPVERAQALKQEFPQSMGVFQNQNQWYIDLGILNKEQLMQVGVSPKHIEAPIACTSCQNDVYFSYRKDTKNTFGEMLGIIGLRSYGLT